MCLDIGNFTPCPHCHFCSVLYLTVGSAACIPEAERAIPASPIDPSK